MLIKTHLKSTRSGLEIQLRPRDRPRDQTSRFERQRGELQEDDREAVSISLLCHSLSLSLSIEESFTWSERPRGGMHGRRDWQGSKREADGSETGLSFDLTGQSRRWKRLSQKTKRSDQHGWNVEAVKMKPSFPNVICKLQCHCRYRCHVAWPLLYT